MFDITDPADPPEPSRDRPGAPAQPPPEQPADQPPEQPPPEQPAPEPPAPEPAASPPAAPEPQTGHLASVVPIRELPPKQQQARREEVAHLGDEISTLAAQIASATARFLVKLAEFDRAEGWAEWEMRSCAHWLSWRCAMSLRTAYEHVRVARALADLPMTTHALAEGELSFSKVRAMSRVATAENEPELVMLATHSTASQVESLCRALRTAARTSGDPADEDVLAGEPLGPPKVQYGARWHWDEDSGDLILWGRFSAEEGALLLAALTRAERERSRVMDDDHGVSGAAGLPAGDADTSDAAGDRAGDAAGDAAGHGPSDQIDDSTSEGDGTLPLRPMPATTAPPGDPGPALVAMALMTLDDLPVPAMAPAAELTFVHQMSPGAAPGAPTDSVKSPDHCSAEHTSRTPPEAECTTRVSEGPGLSPGLVDLVMCTAHQRDVIRDGPAIIAYGRLRRLASPAQVKALLLRDGRHCQAPGCGRTGFLQAHHVVFWSRGGPTDLDNLILLCSGCHTLVHLGRLEVRALGRQRFEFRLPGRESPLPAAPPIAGRADELLYGKQIEPATIAGRWQGEHLDRSLTTSTLLSLWRLRKRASRAVEPAA